MAKSIVKKRRSASSSLSWKARRVGPKFCSPACGGGCTWADHQEAGKLARALARKMGRGWTTRIWENLGWHHEAISPCGCLRIHSHHDRTEITAILGDAAGSRIRWMEHAGTPRAACAAVVARAARERSEIDDILMGLAHLPGEVAAKAVEICGWRRVTRDAQRGEICVPVSKMRLNHGKE
jgi:hypothetical protein